MKRVVARIPFIVVIALMSSPATAADAPADIPTPKFERQVIDDKLKIGYGVAIGDVDGDGKPDILLADQKQFVWYRNGDWKRFVMAEDLTPQDNVCITARDIDGSGKVSVAVGAGWNPSETNDPTKSGGVFYLIRPADPTQRWEPVRLHHEVTTHRMAWVKTGPGKTDFQLVVVPLHGLGNKDGKGAGVRMLAYDVPKDPHGEWNTHLLDDSMHMTHNFDVVSGKGEDAILIGGREGVAGIGFLPNPTGGTLKKILYKTKSDAGVGEVRLGPFYPEAHSYLKATIEPMHGSQLVIHDFQIETGEDHNWVVDKTLAEGHALACSDLLGIGRDQVVAGWRVPNAERKVGIKLYVFPPKSLDRGDWQTHGIDDNQMACEDLKIADLDGDGQPDIIASGRATHNLVIYWNRTRSK